MAEFRNIEFPGGLIQSKENGMVGKGKERDGKMIGVGARMSVLTEKPSGRVTHRVVPCLPILLTAYTTPLPPPPFCLFKFI